ncbi:glycosyltransferase [Compostibacter hankyongensis]|uniref:Glycosyltransferase n=1 Tax=Compostibacter hankyongensis TaxID=1007089 RepID=A0ABP8FTZ6_9BACT
MNIWLLLMCLFAAVYTLLLVVYRYGWIKQPFFEAGRITISGKTKVSLIIPARNEEASILTCLKAISEQNYPAALLEVLVVDDHSTDRTAELVRQFPASNVKLVDLAAYLSENEQLNAYKKKAIAVGIGLSTGTLILTTDADCVMGSEWVATLVKYYENRPVKFIAAPVAFHQERNFFEVFQSLDFLCMQGITGAAARLKCGTMCNGANLAYEKQAFLDVGAFKGIDCIASGDDMLLMYKMYKAYPDGIAFLKSPDAVVHTRPMPTLRTFLEQRIRWASKADRYDDRRLTVVLAFIYLWNVALLLFFLAGFFHPAWWLVWLALLLYKTAAELFFLAPVARFFRKSRQLWQFLPAQLLHIPYIVVSGWLGKFGSYRWKGREVK